MASSGLIIHPVIERGPVGPAFDETGMPTAFHVNETLDGVISATHLEMCNARREGNTKAILDLMLRTAVYAEYIEEKCELPRMRSGKLNILETILEDGYSHIVPHIPRQR